MNCKFCNKEIADSAIRCKYCRNILAPSSQALANNETSPWNLKDVIFLYCEAFFLSLVLGVFIIPIALMTPIDFENESLLSLIQVLGDYASVFIILWLVYRQFKRSYQIPVLEALKFGPLGFKNIAVCAVLGSALSLTGVLVASRILELGKYDNGFFSYNSSMVSLGLNIFFICVVGPFCEEVLFRGLLYPALNKKWGIGTAILFTTILFALFHIFGRYSKMDSFAYYLLFTYLITWVRAKTNSTTATFLMHFSYNITLVGLWLIRLRIAH